MWRLISLSVVIDAGERVFVRADGDSPVSVLNAGSATVYYGSKDVTASSNDGNVVAGASVSLSSSKWFFCATGSRLEVSEDEAAVRASTLEVATSAGFFGATAVGQRSAYTQTYSTAARSVPALTAVAPAALTAVAAVGEAPTAAEYDALLADVTAVRAEVVKLVADALADKKVITALIDDLQAFGLVA